MKKWSTIWELTKVNILYSNPQAVAAIKKKQAKRPDKALSAYKSIFRQQIFALLMMFAIYGVMMSAINFKDSPAYLSLQIAAFSFISLLYFFISLFSVFYDSKDTKLYLPLPVKSEDIYLSKLLASQGTGLPFLSPVLAYLTVAYWQFNHSILAPVIALIMFGLLLVLNNSLSLIALFFVGKLLAKSPYKKLISSFFMFLGISLSSFILIFLQRSAFKSIDEGKAIITFMVPYFRGFYDVYRAPFSQEALLNFWLGLVVLVGLVLFIRHKILPNYISETLKMDANVITKRQLKKTNLDSSLTQTLTRHHLSNLKDPTLLIQSLLQPLIFAFIFLGPAFNGQFDKLNIGIDYFGISLLFGTFIGMMISSPVSFLGVGMSLERDNYHFIKALPINFRQFTIQKFWLLGLAQLIFPALVYSLLAIFLIKLSLGLLLTMLLGMVTSSFVFGEWVYSRDHRLLLLNWQNINQLFYRGGGQWLLAGLQFLIMIIGFIAIGASIILGNVMSPLLVSNVLTAIIIIVLLVIHILIQKSFWKKII